MASSSEITSQGAKVMSVFQSRKVFPLRIVSMCLRAIERFIRQGLLVVIALYLFSPHTPHLLVDGIRTSPGKDNGSYCTYLGSRGIHKQSQETDCALFQWIDRGEDNELEKLVNALRQFFR